MSVARWLKRRWEWAKPFREIKRPQFPVNTELEAMAQAIRIQKKLGDPKPIRRQAI